VPIKKLSKSLLFLATIFVTILFFLPRGPSINWVKNEFFLVYPNSNIIDIVTQDDVDNLEYLIQYKTQNNPTNKTEIWRFMDQGWLSLQFFRTDESYRNELVTMLNLTEQ